MKDFILLIAAWKPLIDFGILFTVAGFASLGLATPETGWGIVSRTIRFGCLGGGTGVFVVEKIGQRAAICLAAFIGLALVKVDQILELTGLSNARRENETENQTKDS